MTEHMSLEEFREHLDGIRSATGLRRVYYDCRRQYYALRRAAMNAPGNAKYAYQRLTRGWDDRSVWDVRDHLARTLGAQLVRMADIAHGYPIGAADVRFIPDEPADDEMFADWVAQLRTHGEALLAYRAGYEDVSWEAREAFAQPAQEALRWVAEHLDDLWD